MDSPARSGKEGGDTRFSTPVSELDDHRFQQPIPPANPEVQRQRRASLIPPAVNTDSGLSPIAGSPAPVTAPATPAAPAAGPTTPVNTLAPPLTFLTPPPREERDGPISRDFEHALTEDELRRAFGSSDKVPRRHRSRHSTRGAHDLEHLDVDDYEVAITSRSSSPPNSVDAFAEPRRRERANTADSRLAPDLKSLARSVSGGTNRRRPTFNNGSVRDLPVDDKTSPEDDVCFPQEIEPTKSFTIDFEAIDEFVAESERDRDDGIQSRRHSFTSSGLNYPATGYQPGNAAKVGSKSTGTFPWKKTDSGNADLSSSEEYDEKCVIEESNDRRGSVAEDQRFSFFSSEIEQTIHVSNIGDLVMPGETFRDLFDLPEENGAWWLDVMNPTEQEIDMFQKAFGIHRLTAEDIENMETREKVELFKQYYFVAFKSFVMDKTREEYLDPVMIYMVVFRDGILTFSYDQNPHAVHVRRRIGKLRNYINLTADWISYALLDDIVDCFAPILNEVEKETDQIEDQVFTLRAEDSIPMLRSIGDCRKKVTSLMRLLGGKADVIKGFAKRCNEQYSMTPRHEIGLYLGDIQDHVVTMMSNLAAFEKMLGRIHSNCLTQLSVDHLMQGNRANEVLSKITVVASVLVPMNLITGLFGMNVTIPGQDSGELYWFFGIVGVILGFISIGLILAKKVRFI